MSLPSTRGPPTPLRTHTDLVDDQHAFFAQHNLDPHQIPPNRPAYKGLRQVQERSVRPRRRRRPPASTTPHPAFPHSQHVSAPVSQFARNRSAAAPPLQNPSQPRSPPSAPSTVDQQIADMTPQQILEAQREIASVLSPDNIAFLKNRSRPAPSPTPLSDSHSPSTPLSADDHVEQQKRLWMTDACVPLESDTSVDSLLSKALHALGPLASHRFDLKGHSLTPHQIAHLPTHLGLHHHGAEPASAGYTLADLLLLTRSTVLGQRVLALRILTALLHNHGSSVSAPLVESGGLALAFAPFPSRLNFEAALTNRIAFIEAVEALVKPHSHLAQDCLVPSFYLASRFYSPNLHLRPPPVLSVLAESACVPVLVNIARHDASNTETEQFALRALAMVRAIVTFSAKSSRDMLVGRATSQAMQQLCLGRDTLRPIMALLACDALSQAIVNAAWSDPELVKSLDDSCFSDTFMRRVTQPLTWFLRDASVRPSECHFQAAKGALRMLRACLTFQRGLMPFTSCAPAVCRLAHEGVELSAEAYLALEAYTHCLYTTVSSEGNGKDDQRVEKGRTAPSPGAVSKPPPGEQLQFAKDQLSGLVPIALEASRVFVSSAQSENPLRKAAAGHFVATLLAIAAIPLDPTVMRKILSQCSVASETIASFSESVTTDGLDTLQAQASLSHAGARTLARVQVDQEYVQREVKRLMIGVKREFRCLDGNREGLKFPWRPASNACAEWIGLFAKVSSSVNAVKMAMDLIPWISDPQIIIDILARCVLRATCLTDINPSLTVEQARKCSEDLLPLAQTDLWELSSRTDPPSGLPSVSSGDRTEHKLLVDPEDLGSMWVKHEGAIDYFFFVATGWFEKEILAPDVLFRILLKSPSAWYETSPKLFPLLQRTASEAIRRGTTLFRSKYDTTLSTISTSPDSDLTTCLLGMADHLVTRGPVSTEGHSQADPLATVILTIMCAPEADDSLRGALWKKTVEECGGAILFERALFLVDRSTKSYRARESSADALMVRYCTAMKRGILTGPRCPPVLSAIIVMEMAAQIESRDPDDPKALWTLKEALKDGPRTRFFYALQEMLGSTARNDHTNIVTNWLVVHEQK